MTENTAPATDAHWKVWYQDNFDRETPRKIEARGVGLTSGLGQLWRLHLREGVTATGSRTFSRFNLWWEQAGQSIEIKGPREGEVILRQWVLVGGERQENLLHTIAVAHARLIASGLSSAELLDTACSARDADDFVRRIEE